MTIRCLLGFHKDKDVKTQRTKFACYGWSNSPGIRITKQCELCGNISYDSLNLAVPYRDLINDSLWR